MNQANVVLSHIDSIVVENQSGHPHHRCRIEADTGFGFIAHGAAEEHYTNDTDNIDQILVNIRVTTENMRQLTDSLKTNPSVLIRGNNVKDRKPGELVK